MELLRHFVFCCIVLTKLRLNTAYVILLVFNFKQ